MFSFTSIKNYQNYLAVNSDGCTAAVKYYLSKIKDNLYLNAFLEVYDEEALQRAKELDAKRNAGMPLGKMHGVIVGLKDVICYKGHKVSASSKILENFISIYSATVVEKLLAEDAIIIGRQNCDEFAMGSSNENSAYGNVLNAKDNMRVPGGSSGGSAVAVQAGLCMASLGSDTGGSVRQPADFCGIVGLKPSYGRVSRYGLIAYASSFDQIGILANSIEDTALVLQVIAGEDSFDSTAIAEDMSAYNSLLSEKRDKKYRLAYFKQAIEHTSLDSEIAAAFHLFVKNLEADGHEVCAIDFNLMDYTVPAYYILTTAEASSNLSRYDGIRYGYNASDGNESLIDFYKHSRSKGFGKEVQRRILLGTFVLSEGYFDAYFTKAQQIRQLLLQKTNEIFNEFDAILCPTVPSPAFKFGEKSKDPVEMFLADIYTVFANLTGIPAISLPLFSHSNGMPFGLQIMTKYNDEKTLLQLSKKLAEIKKAAQQ